MESEHYYYDIDSETEKKLRHDEPMLRFFEDPSATSLQPSAVLRNLAYEIVDQVPRNPERTVALRKLLECQDALKRIV